MSWPYNFPYVPPLLPSPPYIGGISPSEAQLLLHLLRQKSLLESLASPLLNFDRTANPFSSTFNQPLHPSISHCESLPTSRDQLIENQPKFGELKKQESLSNSPDQSDSSKNDQIPLQKLSLQVLDKRTLPRPKNTISHNSSLRNDTKNIPKNYGKAMLSYIQKNSREVKEIIGKFGVEYIQFMIFIKGCKSKINTMHDLREMWGENQKDDKFKKCTRILSYHFMRKKCLPYIFNSRIKNFHTHIKYRKKIMEGIQNPQNFTKIKEF